MGMIKNKNCFHCYMGVCSTGHRRCVEDCEDFFQTCNGCVFLEDTVFKYNKNTNYKWCKRFLRWRINSARGCEYYQCKTK